MQALGKHWLLVLSSLLVLPPRMSDAAIPLTEARTKILTHSVVHVICPSQRASGSGFVYKRGDWIVTALHVVAGCDRVRVSTDTMPERDAEIDRVLPSADLALLKTSGASNGAPPLAVYSTNGTLPPQGLEVIGFDRDLSIAGTQLLVSKCCRTHLDEILLSNELSALGYLAPKTEIIELNGALVHGHSGAPIFDSEGRVVGIGDGGLSPVGNNETSYAIPTKKLTALESAPRGKGDVRLAKISTVQFASELQGRSAPIVDGPVAVLGDRTKIHIRSEAVSGKLVNVVVNASGIFANNRLYIAVLYKGQFLKSTADIFALYLREQLAYDPVSRVVDASKPGYDIKARIGNNEVVVNGEVRPLDAVPFTYGDYVLIELKTFAEAGGGRTPLWDSYARRWDLSA